jgi:hypothetical protein
MTDFVFTYYNISKNKYTENKIIETQTIKAGSAPEAIDIFEKEFGNLRTKLHLIDIREFDDKGKQIGEPIVLKETHVNKELV